MNNCMRKISVIVPVYNTYKELTQCLYSIQNQKYSNLEIICVDDGSTDGSGNIIDYFAKQDLRFKVIHQKNAGESNARNVGLKKATGDVIAFCDCDDYIDLDMYEVLLYEMETYNLDIVAGNWYKEIENENYVIQNLLPITDEVFDRNQLLMYLYRRDEYRGLAYIWNKLYKKEILKDSNGEILMFDEELALGGDVVYLAKAALNATRIKYINKPFYHYNQRTSSGCHTKDVKKLRDWIRAYEIVINLFDGEKIDKNIIDYVKRFLAYHSSNATEIAIDQKAEEAKMQFQYFMRKYKKEYISLNTSYPERIKKFNKLLEA